MEPDRNDSIFEERLTAGIKLRQTEREKTLPEETKRRLAASIISEVIGLSQQKPVVSFWRPWGWILVGLTGAMSLVLTAVYTNFLEPAADGAESVLNSDLALLPMTLLDFVFDLFATSATTDITAVLLFALTVIIMVATRPVSFRRDQSLKT